MEAIVSSLVSRFEKGLLSRRELSPSIAQRRKAIYGGAV